VGEKQRTPSSAEGGFFAKQKTFRGRRRSQSGFNTPQLAEGTSEIFDFKI